MPLPLIPALLWGSAAVGSLIGAKKGWDAKASLDTASALKSEGEREYNAALQAFEAASADAKELVSGLGQLRLETQAGVMSRLVEVVSTVKQFGFVDVRIKDAPALQGVELSEIRENTSIAKDLLQGTATGVGAGAAVYGGVTTLVGTLGTASTGTAIGSLSGAAASKATMAYLGGGAISSGGMGAAAGAVALGATAVGAVAAMGGLAFEKYAEGKLTDATNVAAANQTAAAELRQNAVLVTALGTRAREVSELIRALATRLDESLEVAGEMVGMRRLLAANMKMAFERDKLAFESRNAVTRFFLKLFGKVPREQASPLVFANFDEGDKVTLETTVALGVALYQTLKIELVNEVGEIRDEASGELDQARNVLEGAAA